MKNVSQSISTKVPERLLLLSPFCLKLDVDCDHLGVQWVRFCAVTLKREGLE